MGKLIIESNKGRNKLKKCEVDCRDDLTYEVNLPFTIVHSCLNQKCKWHNLYFPSTYHFKNIELDENGKCTFFDPIEENEKS